MRWINLTSACAQLNKNAHAVRLLAKAGCLQSRMEGCWEEFALEPGVDKQTLLDRWYGTIGPCLDQESCLKMKRVVDLLDGHPRVKPPKRFLDDAMSVIRDDELVLDVVNLRAFTGANVAVARRHVIAWLAANVDDQPETATHFSMSVGDHEDLVLARLPAHLRTAPGTYLAPGSHPDDKPREAVFARLNGIANQTLFEAVTIDVLRLAAAHTHLKLQDLAAKAFTRFDKGLGEKDARDPFVLRHMLEDSLGAQWTTDLKAEGNSCETVLRYKHVHDRIDEYIENVVPSALRPAFRAHQLTMPAGHEKFFRQVKSAVGKYQKACSASRQRRIEHVLDNPLEFLLVGRLRLLEHIGIRDACRAEIDKLIASGETLTAPRRFQHTYRTRLIDEGFRNCEQTVHLAIWSWDLLHDRLRNASERVAPKAGIYANNVSEDPTSRSAYVVAYMGVSPASPGGATQTPLIANVAENHILDAPARLTIEQRKSQIEMRRAYDFGESASKPAGLLWFEKRRRLAYADAKALLTDSRADGSSAPVVLLPHDEFCHGLMFAHSAVFIAADAGCRTGETLLAPSLPSEYVAVTDPATGEVFKQFDSLGKFDIKVQPLVSPNTFRHLTDMIIESADRWHGGKLAPPVAPNFHFQERGIRTVARYAFTQDDRMIGYSELATLARVLYLGWHGIRGHDVRHLFNAMGRRAGIPKEIRQRLLNHESPGSTDLYGPATPTEVNRARIQLNQQTSDAMAKLMREAKGGMSVEMTIALRELRRAEMNVRYYQEGGWTEEAERERRGVEEWAERLARATADHTGGSGVVRVDAL